MTSDGSAYPDAVFDALRDAECREILDALDEPRCAKEIAATCEVSQTSTYRKLEQLSEAGLVEKRTELRRDGHHTSTYVRDFAGVFVTYEDGEFAVDVVSETESAHERLARLWARIGDEL